MDLRVWSKLGILAPSWGVRGASWLQIGHLGSKLGLVRAFQPPLKNKSFTLLDLCVEGAHDKIVVSPLNKDSLLSGGGAEQNDEAQDGAPRVGRVPLNNQSSRQLASSHGHSNTPLRAQGHGGGYILYKINLN